MKSKQKYLKNLSWISLSLILVILVSGCMASAGAPRPGATGNESEAGSVEEITIIDNVESSGSVSASQDASLMWKTTGIVEEVNIELGDFVKTGDVLMSLALTSTPSNIIAAQVDVINAKQALEDLYETDPLAIAQAEQRLANAKDALEDQLRFVDSLGEPARKADIDSARATVLLTKIQLDRAYDRYKPYQNKADNNQIKAALFNQYADAQQKYDSASRRLNNLLGTVSDTTIQVAQSDLLVAEENYQDALQDLEDQKAGATENDVLAAEARITAAEATLSNLHITAPFDGEVLEINYQPGDVASASLPAVTLANRKQLHVDTLIDETDISSIQPGDSVTLTLDALPGVNLTGKVAYINPMGEPISGNVKYSVRIDLDPIDQPVLLGATADVSIQTGKPRPALTVPVRAIQTDEQGEFVIKFLPDGSTARVDVVTGSLQGDRVVVLSGDLDLGDQVQLSTSQNDMFQGMGR